MRTRTILVIPLTVLAMSAAAATSTSASAWLYNGCTKVAPGDGGFENAQCTKVKAGGTYSASNFIAGKHMELCLFGGPGSKYLDPHCSTSGSGSYGLLVKPLLVIVTAARYTVKSKFGGLSVTIACEKMKAREPTITGGEPGKAEAESLEYTGCAPEGLTHCEVLSPKAAAGTIATDAIESELVENTAKTKVESRFFPKSGTTLEEIEFKGSSCALEGTTFPVKGSLLTEVSPEKEMTEKMTLKSEPASRKYINSKGEEKEARLEVGAEAVTLEGTATVEAEVEGVKTMFGAFE
jgi:hypothetical protein